MGDGIKVPRIFMQAHLELSQIRTATNLSTITAVSLIDIFSSVQI